MALRELVEGDCGGANSLVKLSSHFVQDRGRTEDGYTYSDIVPSNSDQLVHQFLEETQESNQPYRMESLLSEIKEMEGRMSPSGHVAESDPERDAQNWAQQYIDDGKVFQEGNLASIWSTESQQSGQMGEVYELGFGPNWADEYLQSTLQGQPLDEPTLADLSTSEEYSEAQDNSNALKETASKIIQEVDDPKFAYSKFMKFMRQIGEGQAIDPSLETEFDNLSTKPIPWWKEFEKLGEGSSESKENAESEASFNEFLWNKLSKQWKEMDGEHPWMSSFEDFSSQFQVTNPEYSFAAENPMEDLTDPLEEGKKKLEEDDLPGAVLCFESAAKQHPENPIAWQYLGTTLAENEQDPQAITALKNCLSLDPDNLAALMSIAVSYTNENYHSQACHALKEWLRVNPKYSDLVPPRTEPENSQVNVSSLMTRELYESVKNLYYEAARKTPEGGIDPDVQCGLGVLFNMTNETDKAVECFETAVEVKPNDSRLWNRIGATLANGNRSEEAVEAYRNALKLSPGFIRARYNLGISCVHLGANREAAEHLLTALNQQAISGQGEKSAAMSDTIWTTLRLVMSLLERPDLMPAVSARDLAKLNQEFGIE